jgi:hypothetical protein
VPFEKSPVDHVAYPQGALWGWAANQSPHPALPDTRERAVIQLGEVVMILDLHRQGLTVSAIARELGLDRKTVRKCIKRGLEAPVYGPRRPRQRLIDPFVRYLRERATAYPGLTGRRLFRELANAAMRVATPP